MEQKYCSVFNIISAIKKLIHLGLFVEFIVMSSFAIRDLLSNETVFRKSTEQHQLSFPSVTFCPYFDGLFTAEDLVKGKMTNSTWPIEIFSILELKNGTKDRINMTNSIDIGTYFNSTFDTIWKPYCKMIYPINDRCRPCFVFNAPKIKVQTRFIEVSP